MEKKMEDVTVSTKDTSPHKSQVSGVGCKLFQNKEKETKYGSTHVRKSVSEERKVDDKMVTSAVQESSVKSVISKVDEVKGSIAPNIIPVVSDTTQPDESLQEVKSVASQAISGLKGTENETELLVKATEGTEDTETEVSSKRVMRKDCSKTSEVKSPLSAKMKTKDRKSPRSEDASVAKVEIPKKELEINTGLSIQNLTFDYTPPKIEEKEVFIVKTRKQTRQHVKMVAKQQSAEKSKKGNKTSKSTSLDSPKQEDEVLYIAERDPLGGANDDAHFTRSRRTRSSTALLAATVKPQPPSKKVSKPEIQTDIPVKKGKPVGQKRRNSHRLDSYSDEEEVAAEDRKSVV
jgi:hypothetical protein